MTQAASASSERCFGRLEIPLHDTEPHWVEEASAWQHPASIPSSWQAGDSQVIIKEKGNLQPLCIVG